eukprot:m.225843 g.225843  ORF g.225843 m.225843 type:complete len:110 (+) comp16813_c0_seq1:236-565(+)
MSVTQASLSTRQAVLGLYRAWYRELPHILELYDLDVSLKAAREQLRTTFLRNKNLKDSRVVDLMVVKGKMELQETLKLWKQTPHVMRFFDNHSDPAPKDFMTRFLKGSE